MNEPVDEIFDISKILCYKDQGWCPESASRSKRLLDIMSFKQREILNGPESEYCVKIGYCCSRKICDLLDCYCMCQSNKLLHQRIDAWNKMSTTQLKNRVTYKRSLLSQNFQ